MVICTIISYKLWRPNNLFKSANLKEDARHPEVHFENEATVSNGALRHDERVDGLRIVGWVSGERAIARGRRRPPINDDDERIIRQRNAKQTSLFVINFNSYAFNKNA